MPLDYEDPERNVIVSKLKKRFFDKDEKRRRMQEEILKMREEAEFLREKQIFETEKNKARKLKWDNSLLKRTLSLAGDGLKGTAKTFNSVAERERRIRRKRTNLIPEANEKRVEESFR